MQKPCNSKDVLVFEFKSENLAKFLDFLELKSKESGFDISELKIKTNNLDQNITIIKNQLPDFKKFTDTIYQKIDSINDKLGNLTESHNKNVSRFNDFESKSNQKLESMKEDIDLVEEDFKKKIEKIQYQMLQFNQDFNLKKIELESRMSNLTQKVDKIPDIEKDINTIKEKIIKKFIKNKDKWTKNSSNILEIENNIKTMFGWFSGLDDKDAITSKMQETNNLQEAAKSKFEFLRKELEASMSDTKLNFEKIEKDIVEVRNVLVGTLKNESEDKVRLSKEEKMQMMSGIEEVRESVRELQINEKYFVNAISGKMGREEVDRNIKILSIELESTNHKLSKLSKEFATKIKEDNEVKNEDNIVTRMGGVEEVKRVMIQTIKENEHFEKLKERQEFCDSEIIKINEICMEMKKVVKEELSNPKFIEIKDLVTRLSDIEENERNLKSMIDELKGDEVLTPLDKRQSIKGVISNVNSLTNLSGPVVNSTASSIIKNLPTAKRGSLVKDFVIELQLGINQANERLEKIEIRLDSMNKDNLDRVKKDLLFESNKILDEFRLDLKFSISKIEEQMREKVDKFNMEEFIRKFEKRMILEMNSKIDRIDLKKNNSLINRKIDTLENKISKTLVDTLIDLQMDDAPLLIKKSMAGSDKCASCNQNLPTNNMHHSNCITEQHTTNAGTKSNKNLKTQTKYLDKAEGQHNISSAGNWGNLPDISNIDKKIKTNLNSPKRILTPGKVKIRTSTNSFQKFDELTERQLNGLIKEELDKNIVNPDKLIKASKKVYDTLVDKKQK